MGKCRKRKEDVCLSDDIKKISSDLAESKKAACE